MKIGMYPSTILIEQNFNRKYLEYTHAPNSTQTRSTNPNVRTATHLFTQCLCLQRRRKRKNIK